MAHLTVETAPAGRGERARLPLCLGEPGRIPLA
jgi:hypothetical protein